MKKDYFAVEFDICVVKHDKIKPIIESNWSTGISSIPYFCHVFDFDTDILEHLTEEDSFKDLEENKIYHGFISGVVEIDEYLNTGEYQELCIDVICYFNTISFSDTGEIA